MAWRQASHIAARHATARDGVCRPDELSRQLAPSKSIISISAEAARAARNAHAHHHCGVVINHRACERIRRPVREYRSAYNRSSSSNARAACECHAAAMSGGKAFIADSARNVPGDTSALRWPAHLTRRPKSARVTLRDDHRNSRRPSFMHQHDVRAKRTGGASAVFCRSCFVKSRRGNNKRLLSAFLLGMLAQLAALPFGVALQ